MTRLRRLGLVAVFLLVVAGVVYVAANPLAESGRGDQTPPRPVPTVPPVQRGELWISRNQIMALPMSGPAWDSVSRTANSGWGQPNLGNNNSRHDTSTLAGALVATRTGNPLLAAKTRLAIMDMVRSDRYQRVLELARNITSYVIAADIVRLDPADDAEFRSFISELRTKPLKGHAGGTDLASTALRAPSNWGTMSRAAMAAIDLYLGDQQGAGEIALAHRAWLGEDVANQLVYTDTAWHPDGAAKAGINRRGAMVDGRNADGIEPEDQRRTGEPDGDPVPRGSYPWEALQGAVVTGVLLDRAGLVDIRAGDDALARAFTWLYFVNDNPPGGDDRWLPWLFDRVAGATFPTESPTTPGKNMGWTDWTHQPVS